MTRQNAINIINNYDGVFAIKYNNKVKYDEIRTSGLIQATSTLKAVVLSKEWYDDGGFGIVKYRLLGEIRVV